MVTLSKIKQSANSKPSKTFRHPCSSASTAAVGLAILMYAVSCYPGQPMSFRNSKLMLSPC
ncbi:hypothetical protein BJY01DRAFT_210988 [Aspergillus pseudoustus]|uniref:Uncharacterized protein n=1 Tax=Aspergillus pseudoustus TaxID=1810923 RepID=A0ABR4KAD4_9EURO